MTVRNFGEICNDTAECSDHRYVCKEDEFHIQRCFCDRFHLWMGIENGCVQIVNVSDIIKTTSKKYRYKGNSACNQTKWSIKFIENEADRLFWFHIVSGLFIAIIVAITVLFVIIYLYRIHKKDNRMKKELIRRAKELQCDHFDEIMRKYKGKITNLNDV